MRILSNTAKDTAKVLMSLILIPAIAIAIVHLIIIPLIPKELPSNGYVSDKIIKYFVVVEGQEVEITMDQYYYTPPGQWIDFEAAKGVKR